MKINKKRRVSRSLGWGESIGSNEVGSQQEGKRAEGNSTTEVEIAVGNQLNMLNSPEPFSLEAMIVQERSDGSCLITATSALSNLHTRPEGEKKRLETCDLLCLGTTRAAARGSVFLGYTSVLCLIFKGVWGK